MNSITKIECATLTADVSNYIIALETRIKELKAELEAVKAALLKSMTEGNVMKMENDDLSITRIDETDTESFDSKAFRKNHPDLYDQYVRISTKKPYVRIKVK